MDFVDIGYSTQAIGLSIANMVTRMNAVPLPLDVFNEQGLRIVTDATPAANPVVRTVKLGFGPTGLTDAVAVIQNDGTIAAITPGNRGNDYVKPPFVSLSPVVKTPAQLRAFLRVNATMLEVNNLGGAGYVAPITVTFIGGLPPAGRVITSGCVRRIFIVDSGLGYPVGTTISIDGGGPLGNSPTPQATATITRDGSGQITSVTLTDMGAGYVAVPKVSFHTGGVQPLRAAKIFVAMAEGTPARPGVVTIVATAITAIAVASPGSGYVGLPTILIRSALGSGAVYRARLELDRVDTLFAGKGYPGVGATTVAFTPFFKAMFPNTSDQGAPFARELQSAFVNGALTPIKSLIPVLT